jgi:ribonuclease P/MRP protein subunit POP5
LVKTYKKRYLLFQLRAEETEFERNDVWRAIQDVTQTLFGSFGLSHANVSLILYDEKSCLGILRCSHRFLDPVRAALLFLTDIKGKDASVSVLRVSGTIRSLRKLGKDAGMEK